MMSLKHNFLFDPFCISDAGLSSRPETPEVTLQHLIATSIHLFYTLCLYHFFLFLPDSVSRSLSLSTPTPFPAPDAEEQQGDAARAEP